MGGVVLFFGVACALVAWRTDDRDLRIGMLIGAALNLIAFAHMLATGFDFTWQLLPPDDGPLEPAWRR